MKEKKPIPTEPTENLISRGEIDTSYVELAEGRPYTLPEESLVDRDLSRVSQANKGNADSALLEAARSKIEASYPVENATDAEADGPDLEFMKKEVTRRENITSWILHILLGNYGASAYDKEIVKRVEEVWRQKHKN